MNSVTRIIKESRIIYLILTIVFFSTTVSKIASAATSNMMPLGTGFFYGLLLFFGISISVIGINLINNFQLALVFNRKRNSICHDLFKYILFISLASSVLINFLGLILHYFPENPLVPMIFGMNFNIINGILIRILITSLIFIALGIAGLWLAATFSVHGTLNGISAIILTAALLISISFKIIQGFLWANQLPFLLVTLLAVTIVLTTMTHLTLLKLEIH